MRDVRVVVERSARGRGVQAKAVATLLRAAYQVDPADARFASGLGFIIVNPDRASDDPVRIVDATAQHGR